MPTIYLSPSTQEWNQYVTGSGSEEYNMNLLADALVPYLLSNAIQYKRNRPEMTAGSSIREANRGTYDLYLALHSNGAPEGRYGEERGIIAFYYPTSRQGQRAAELIAQVGMGVLMKVIPQINVFAINIELKVIVGLGLLLVLTVPFSEFLLQAEMAMLNALHDVLALTGTG